MPVMLDFNRNYADEFSVSGFIVMKDDEWKQYKAKAKEVIGNKYYDWYFGTNEFISFSDYKEYIKSFTVTKLTDAEYEMMLKLFGSKEVDGWNGKKFTKTIKIIHYGKCPYYYSDDEWDELKTMFEEREGE